MRAKPLLLLMCMLLPFAAEAAFNFETVADQAKQIAAKPYTAPPEIPRVMRDMSYNEYQSIRFNPDKSLWQETKTPFKVMFFSPGLFYTHPVKMNVVDGKGAQPIPFRKDAFTFDDQELERKIPADLGYAGFRLTYPLEQVNEQNQFLVFAGASYFRGVAKGNAWGISGRGIAIDTGLMSGEEFPSFVEFWLVRPAANAKSMTFYGLLDSKSLTGAYEFVVTPGATTELQVKAMLFPRQDVELLGVAPLTSMFYYGANTGRPTGEWRGAVHDSEGLLIHNGATSEWLWRPLTNPKHLQMDYFQTENVRGFGLLQRTTDFKHYQDLGARYDKRPSAWVEPKGDWGKGQVVLVQLPTDSETNDNIVAFWTPQQKVTASAPPIQLAYRVLFGGNSIAQETLGKTTSTFVGDGHRVGGGDVPGAYRFIVDYRGGPLDTLLPGAAVTASVSAQDGGEVLEHFVEYNEPLKSWRLSILARPTPEKPLQLRAFLREGENTLTETWNYRLEPENDIRAQGD